VVKVSGVTAIFVALFQPYWITPVNRNRELPVKPQNLVPFARKQEWA
jgi:hypothetical protein